MIITRGEDFLGLIGLIIITGIVAAIGATIGSLIGFCIGGPIGAGAGAILGAQIGAGIVLGILSLACALSIIAITGWVLFKMGEGLYHGSLWLYENLATHSPTNAEKNLESAAEQPKITESEDFRISIFSSENSKSDQDLKQSNRQLEPNVGKSYINPLFKSLPSSANLTENSQAQTYYNAK